MAKKSTIVFYVIISAIVVFSLAGLFYMIFQGIHTGIDEEGYIRKINPQLTIAKPDRLNIVESELENQEAVKALEDKIDFLIEYNLELQEQISEGGGTIIVNPENGDIKIDFNGQTAAGSYSGEAGTVNGEVYHKLSQKFNPIDLQVYIDKKGEIAIASTSNWVDISVDKVYQEPLSWWDNCRIQIGVLVASYDDKVKPMISVGAGYKHFLITCGYTKGLTTVGFQYNLK